MIVDWLPNRVARVQASIHSKLLWAFLLVVGMMLASALVGLRALSEVNRRAEDMVQLQRKIAAYRQLNHDTVAQLYSVASSLLKPEERTLQATLRQLNQFGYDLDRLQFVAQDEKEIFARLRQDYEEFIGIVTQVMELIRTGKVAEGHDLQMSKATPHTERLERLTNELVNKAESDMVISIDATHEAYADSRKAVAIFAVASVVLALLLGYSISSSIVRPVRQMESRMREIGSGNFWSRLEVPNRDELGVLAMDVNRMSEQLGLAYRELESASQHKSEFLANMSHELRTPLNAIIGFSEVLRDGLFGTLVPKQAEYMRAIHASGQHLLLLINDILDLSKVEAGRMELSVTRFDMPAAIENAMLLVRERAQRNGITLSREIERGVGVIAGDERMVKQILLNLLSNAVKFTPSGGRVLVQASPTSEGVQVAVKDTGIGIDPSERDSIFDAFRQGNAGKTGAREGTGLGLTLARRFVEMHKGRIWLESEMARGTTFFFTLESQ
ncbi:MAG: ATP-binding protein [Burkholderiales bacterium]